MKAANTLKRIRAAIDRRATPTADPPNGLHLLTDDELEWLADLWDRHPEQEILRDVLKYDTAMQAEWGRLTVKMQTGATP